MGLNKLILLDKEEQERINDLLNNTSKKLIDILKYEKIKNALLKDIIIVQGSPTNPINIASSLPLHSFVFFELCPDCTPNIEIFKPLLDTDCVFPILLKGYEDCPEPFVSELLKYPHMSVYEFATLRYNILVRSIEKGVCPHCLDENISNDIEIFCKNIPGDEGKELAHHIINYIIQMLSPFESFDDELLIILKRILQQANYETLCSFSQISNLIGRTKTAIAFKSPLSISSKVIRVSDFQKYMPKDLNDVMQFSDDFLIKGLELDFPANLNISKYIDIIMNNRKRINKIAKNIINKSSKNETVDNADISTMLNEIANINEQIRSIQKSKKYKLYKIGTDILSANKGLISTLFCATILGFYGNLAGCGISASAGIVGKIFKSFGKFNAVMEDIKARKPIQELREIILDSLESPFQKILSIYFWKDLNVVQAMRIKEKIQKN